MVIYEWDHETTNIFGCVLDHSFADKLSELQVTPDDFARAKHDLVLVRHDGIESVWAYCRWVNGELILPNCWNKYGTDPGHDMPNWKVPKKFHAELKRWFNS